MAPIFLSDDEQSDHNVSTPFTPAPRLGTNGIGTPMSSVDSDGPYEPRGPEPIAIIGMGCKLPGGASTPSKLWDLLEAGRSAQGRLPADRYNMDAFYHPNGDRPGSMNTEGGYFIQEDVRGFDNSMFGINNLEAMYMDPQQRKLLEVTFEAMESAGLTLEGVSGANMGCYVGNFVTDFITMQLKDAEYTHRYTATGSGTTILANRISHVFNLKGPSFVIDTACSSSLYCLHAACSALWQGECDSAVVAGANLVQSPEQQLATMKAGVLSKTSTCHTFDSSADGYGRADGIGVLLVKRLSDALRDGDPIRSVIRGSAINSNGRTNGITLPSADGQESVIRKAYAQAGLGFDQTAYVECHGTGTAVGDPIETESLSRIFSSSSPDKSQPLLIGSVKTNLGHSEAASGISSLIKVALALEKGRIPPTVGLKSLNPKIKLDEWNMRIVTEPIDWPLGQAVRRAGVNSFGYGGANAHCILEAPDTHLPPGYSGSAAAARLGGGETAPRTSILLPVSSHAANGLADRAADLAEYVASRGNVDPADLAYTLGERRSHLSARGFWIADPEKLASDLHPEANKLRTRASGKAYSKLPLLFVFTGQGAQWAGMGRELLSEFATFRRTIQALDSALQLLPHPPTWTLRGTLLEADPEKSTINRAERSQPVCTAVQVALIDLLREWGVQPQAVVGHSSGEIGAAYAAGRLSARQAIIVAYYRGFAVDKIKSAPVIPGAGAMMAAGLGRTDAEAELDALRLGADRVRVACVNSPESVTISGDADAVSILKSRLDSRGVFARLLKTDGQAYHSHRMAPVGALYEPLLAAALSSLDDDDDLPPSGVKWVSSVTNEEVADEGMAPPEYWRANLESPVLFSPALETIVSSSPDQAYHLVEIGPHSALEMPIKQTLNSLEDKLDASKYHYNTALVRGKDSVGTVLGLAGELFLHGHNLAFGGINRVSSPTIGKGPNKGARRTKRTEKVLTDLPKYRWDYSGTVFHEPRLSQEWRNRKHPRHDLLGSRVLGGDGVTLQWRNILKVNDLGWLSGHKLDTVAVLPAAGYLAMAVEAVCQASDVSQEEERRNPKTDRRLRFGLRHVHVEKALVIPEGNQPGIEVFTTLVPADTSKAAPKTSRDGSSWYHFTVSSFLAGEATRHAHGLVKLDTLSASSTLPKQQLPVNADDMEPSAARTWYKKFVQEGLNFTGPLQSLDGIQTHRRRGRMHLLSQTLLSPGDDKAPESAYALHPVAIDALFQTGPIAATRGVVRDFKAMVPVYIEDMTLLQPSPSGEGVKGSIRTVCKPASLGAIRVDSQLCDEQGEVLLRLTGSRMVHYRSSSSAEGTEEEHERHPMLRVVWKPDIDRLGDGGEDALTAHLSHYQATTPISEDDELVATQLAGGVLDLAVHKKPGELNVLLVSELGKDEAAAEAHLQTLLAVGTAFQRCRSLWHGRVDGDGSLQFDDLSHPGAEETTAVTASPEKFDVVVILRTLSVQAAAGLVAEDGGCLVWSGLPSSVSSVTQHISDLDLGFATTESRLGSGPAETVLARRLSPSTPTLSGKQILIVERKGSAQELNAELASRVSDLTGGTPVQRVSLEDVTAEQASSAALVLATFELEHPLLADDDLRDADFAAVKVLTDNSSTLVWVTGGGLADGSRPEHAVVFGLSRALMFEQPELRFFVVGVDSASAEIKATAGQVAGVVGHALVSSGDNDEKQPDYEFVQARGCLHVSRFVPEDDMNAAFRRRLAGQQAGVVAVETKLGEAHPCRLNIEGGALATNALEDSLVFATEETQDGEEALAEDQVEVRVGAVGLHARDLGAMTGGGDAEEDNDDDSPTALTSQYAGTVVRVGSAVTDLSPGSRVLVLAPGRFATVERVSASACVAISEDEDQAALASIPLPAAAALHALRDRAALQTGESVLVCYRDADARGGDRSGPAAVRVARALGADDVFALVVVDDDDVQEQEIALDLNLPADHVLVIRAHGDESATGTSVARLVGAAGLQVVANFCAEQWPLSNIAPALAPGARLVHVGDGAVLAGLVATDPTILRRNVSLSTFDVGSLLSRPQLLRDALDLWRTGKLTGLLGEPRIFDIADLASALRALLPRSSSSHGGRGAISVSFADETSQIRVTPRQDYRTAFSADKSYLLVGCLGGLGRSMSRWMLARGARKFVFLGRSGTDRASARRLVQDLEVSGATVSVVRGDVVSRGDVERTVAAAVELGPIGGVVQAAMGLDESLFTAMPASHWHKGLLPKVRGTRNLHDALASQSSQLDFFLMTSSVSGSVGTATESNYCSANYFLDVFARHRRSLGLPATSVGLGMISEVGYLHENPEIEAMLLRKGIQAINEDEMLHIIDIALYDSISSSSSGTETGRARYDDHARAHTLTGLEPIGVRELRAQGFDVSSPVLADPRAGLLAAALAAEESSSGSGGSGSGSSSEGGLPAAVAQALGSRSRPAVAGAALELIADKFSNLVLVPRDRLDLAKPLSDVGVDSMLAAEFRGWIYRQLKVDVPYLTMLSSAATLTMLSELIAGKLLEA